AWPASSVNFESVSARHYRIALQARGSIVLGEIELHTDGRIEGIPTKAAFMHQRVFPTQPGAEFSAETIAPRGRVLDLTSKMSPDGRLAWDVPAGSWTVLRLGYTTTGKTNHPAPRESEGLECDKLSKRAVEAHFAGLLGKLVDDQRAVGGTALKFAHIDSWEVGSQNWTPGFREEFRKRRGYDLLPFLPVVTGRAVEGQQITERFLWDWRRTVADMLLDNYAGHMRELSHRHGLQLSIEGYGGGPLDDLAYAGRADMPMSEFWTGKELYESWVGEEPHPVNKEMASAAHVYGRPVIGAEAFTAVPRNGKWLNHPFRLKALGDTMFTQGVNRIIFHRYAMQPWVDRKPGMTMGPYGIHFERTNTWWEQSTAWLAYLARCQYLLRTEPGSRPRSDGASHAGRLRLRCRARGVARRGHGPGRPASAFERDELPRAGPAVRHYDAAGPAQKD
ncbi:MAG: glycosyl hydrolase, partial [Acidobacteria bacterium]|nr:glycosyl hydrolase [Acidobacteriota bacterium]